ncbi:MAG: hypothetical protein AAF408_10505, partial [Pseudomonadota bacterium]
TPLAKTIPTLLAIALIYEIFPVDHFHPLLPLSAVLIALAADWSRFHLIARPEAGPAIQPTEPPAIPPTEPPTEPLATADPQAAPETGGARDNV